MKELDASLIQSIAHNRLQWFPELGYGWYPVQESPYDAAYWERYRVLDQTDCGRKLTERRIALVDKYWYGSVVDVGIGGGRFVQDHGHETKGFDVNPDAIRWLYANGKWHDPYEEPVEALTFWDSLEHIHNPEPLLANALSFVFISTPIYENASHVLRSKHFRPTEHCWYFTVRGMVDFMKRFGFEFVEFNNMEQACGREDIGTFVFGRKS